jgi:hypothetical protein
LAWLAELGLLVDLAGRQAVKQLLEGVFLCFGLSIILHELLDLS